MGITVKEIIALQTMKGSVVVAGKGGLSNVVEGISLMESHDSVDFIPSGTLVLTNARALSTYSSPLAWLVKQLAENNVAGMALKRNRYLKRIPEDMLAVADAENFPIVLAPADPTPTQIINAVTYEIFRTETHDVNCTFDENFLKSIAIGNEDPRVLKNRLTSNGWDIKRRMGVVAAWSELFESESAQFVRARKAAGFDYGFELFGVQVAMMPLDSNDPNAFESACVQLSRNLSDSSVDATEWFVGASTDSTLLIHLPRALYEAQSALWFAIANKEPFKLYHFDKLGIFSIVLLQKNSHEFARYLDRSLGCISMHDKKNNTCLFDTLVVYAENDGSVERTAHALNVHYNTVRHRLKEIKRVLASNLIDGNVDMGLGFLCLVIKWMKVRQWLSGRHPDGLKKKPVE